MKKINRFSWLAVVLGCAILTGQLAAHAAILTNRYSFTTDASDSVGGQNGTLGNGASVSGGAVQLDGITQFVQLPANLTTNLSSVSVEAWLTPATGNGAWARIWDFGTQTTNADGSTGSAQESYCTIIDGAGGGLAVQMDGT